MNMMKLSALILTVLCLVGFQGPASAQVTTAHEGVDIVQDPANLPPPIGKRGPKNVKINLETIEVAGQLADGTTYDYFTYNGKVPGPFLRVRVGDTVTLSLKNNKNNSAMHSIDLHAVTGPGGGAAYLKVPQGEEKTIRFKALIPGLYVYHCAIPTIAQHISNGQYGLILVEPEGGLPPVDREFYVMQGEIYTEEPFGIRGKQFASIEKLLNENPEYFVFNGAAAALATGHPLRAKVGETVRIYFGVGGPNFTSSFHVIGEMFDHVYEWGGLLSDPVEGVQTITVPPGGAAVVDFKLEVPGKYILVDHALSRLEKGLVGLLYAEGDENPEVYQNDPK
jgi:nitrite reductase (NO-forming)